jgi:hypothetical protein
MSRPEAILRDAEVEQLDDDVSGVESSKEHVGRLDVAVDDADLVRLEQAQAGLRDDSERELGW